MRPATKMTATMQLCHRLKGGQLFSSNILILSRQLISRDFPISQPIKLTPTIQVYQDHRCRWLFLGIPMSQPIKLMGAIQLCQWLTEGRLSSLTSLKYSVS